MSKEPVLDMVVASYTKGYCLDPKYRAGRWEKVNSAEYHRKLTRGPATTCIGYRASEGQLEVRRLVASAVLWIILLNLVFWEHDICLGTRYSVIVLQLWPKILLLVDLLPDCSGCCLTLAVAVRAQWTLLGVMVSSKTCILWNFE